MQPAGRRRSRRSPPRVLCCPSWVERRPDPTSARRGNPLFRGQMSYGEGRRLASALQIELGEYVADVMLDRLRRDEEPRGDLPVGQTFAKQGEDLVLAAGETAMCVWPSSCRLDPPLPEQRCGGVGVSSGAQLLEGRECSLRLLGRRL